MRISGGTAALAATLFMAMATMAADNKTGPSPPSGSDAGPFPPKADPSISAPLRPEPRAAAPLAASEPAAEATAARQREAARWAEEQLDRAEEERLNAQREAARTTTAPIVGAFTGSTSERDR